MDIQRRFKVVALTAFAAVAVPLAAMSATTQATGFVAAAVQTYCAQFSKQVPVS